jgi:serine/threonine protein kinase
MVSTQVVNVDHYFIEEALGSGGMAVVYRATDIRTGTPVALKVLHGHWAANQDIIRRFRREAKIASELRHDYIVPILNYGEGKGGPYLVMKYMVGGNLADHFEKPSRVSLRVSSRLLLRIASALDYAHSRDLIHRDLKLENILLDEKYRPALADFGLARLRDSTRLTQTGIIAGTPLYMSPEQALGKRDLDHRSDVYSFAVMAYLMATGFHPFTASDALAILNQHLTMPPPVPSKVNTALPAELDTVLLKGLAKSPEDRHNTVGEFAQDFAHSVQRVSSHKTLIKINSPNPIEPDTKTHHRAPYSRSRRLSLLGTFAVLVAIFSLGLFALSGGLGTTEETTPDPLAGIVEETPTQTELAAVVEEDTPTPTQTATPLPTVFTWTPENQPPPTQQPIIIPPLNPPTNSEEPPPTQPPVIPTITPIPTDQPTRTPTNRPATETPRPGINDAAAQPEQTKPQNTDRDS